MKCLPQEDQAKEIHPLFPGSKFRSNSNQQQLTCNIKRFELRWVSCLKSIQNYLLMKRMFTLFWSSAHTRYLLHIVSLDNKEKGNTNQTQSAVDRISLLFWRGPLGDLKYMDMYCTSIATPDSPNSSFEEKHRENKRWKYHIYIK